MKTKLIAFAFLATTIVHAQNMKPSAIHSETSRYKEIARILAEDNTDLNTYIMGKFTCHNFSKTLYLQRSNLVKDIAKYNLEGIKEDWGIDIEREAHTDKLPLYTVNLTNEESGFYHSINAVLVKPEAPESLDSYVYIEPQTDEILETPELMYQRYSKHLQNTDAGKILDVSIGKFEGLKHNGHIYQYLDSSLIFSRISY